MTACREVVLVLKFWANPQKNFEALAEHVRGCRGYRCWGRTRWSPSGLISADLDVYGPEVKIWPSSELLDCSPQNYGLEREQAMALYEAIVRKCYETRK